ncbi:MAG: hypothetical protein R3195_06545 [Gemmatimonadota bacterium]|nr:hypothetical protein [Gemmatimonadota bacterium]
MPGRITCLAGLLAASTCGGAIAQAAPRVLGADLLEALISEAYPGATIDWDAAVLHRPDGNSDRIEISCYISETREGRRVTAVALDFPALIEAAVEKAIPVGEATSDDRPARIAVAPLGPSGELLDVRVGTLDPEGHTSSCLEIRLLYDAFDAMFYDLDLVPSVPDPSAPFLEVHYRTLHDLDDGLGVVQWLGVRDGRTLVHRTLLPVAVSLEAGGAWEQFEIRRPAPREFEFQGMNTGRTWRYRCPAGDVCLVPAAEVLGWLARP